MAFPVSPTEGQTYTEDNTVWIYSAITGQWNRSVVNPGNSTDYRSGKGYVGSDLTVDGDIQLDDGGTFTTTLQTITPTANRTISLPNATGTVALVAGSSGQLVYNNAGAQAGAPGSTVGATGDVTLGLNGAASTPPLELTGTWFTGGTSTTTKPQLLIEPAGTTSTAWSTSGTGLGVNAASGFTGRLLDLQTNGTSRAVVTGAGNVLVGTTTASTGALLQVNGSQRIRTYNLVINANSTATLSISESAFNGGMQITVGGWGSGLTGNISGLWLVTGFLFQNLSGGSTITQIVNSVSANGSMTLSAVNNGLTYDLTITNTHPSSGKQAMVSLIFTG